MLSRNQLETRARQGDSPPAPQGPAPLGTGSRSHCSFLLDMLKKVAAALLNDMAIANYMREKFRIEMKSWIRVYKDWVR